ncbi:MAG: thermonuclease family protein [Ilumatobacter sp.]|uniref:thermonuclease family protein n=1 Tax=Ilumatobacter sp. TaxID=1967498 RepID=UPI003C728C39
MLSRVSVIVALAGVGCAACDTSAEPTPTTAIPGAVEANATVDFVIDGDTIDAIIDGREERIRLIGIDTPETKKPNSPIECFGPEATAFTESLLPVGTPIRIERDTVNRDDFGRLLGYVYRAEDGVFVNYETIRQGFATPLSIEPNTTYIDLFVDAARSAESDDVGLWSACKE